jgi:hypothetical protein
MTNPFRSTSMFNLPLTLPVCQQMHAAALLRVARGMEAVPGSVPVARLRELVPCFGPETCLAHPAEIEHRFRRVTLAIYQRIYCSWLARSIQMVTRILDAMARCENRVPVHEEAIWAICLYLDERRLQQTSVTTEQLDATWWIGAIVPGASATAEGDGEDDASRYALVGVIDVSQPRLLAFRQGAHRSEAELATLALYDALVHARLPHALGAGGLVWQVPTRLVATGTLSEACKAACASLGMAIERASTPPPLTRDLQRMWTDLRTRSRLRAGRSSSTARSTEPMERARCGRERRPTTASGT